MKRKSVFKEVPLSPYAVDLWILISNDPHYSVLELNQKYKGLSLKWGSDYAAWTEDVFYKDNYLTVVFDAASCDPETIAHEAIHVKNMVMKHSGWKQDPDNDEPEAYFVGFIVKAIDSILQEYKKKR
jgi:hypothetical protein